MTTPKPRPPVAATGLLTSVDDVLRLVLGRLDADRATADVVRDALHAAGVVVSREWAEEWLSRARGARGGEPHVE